MLERLIHRQEMLQREIEQAEIAGTPDNPWAERAALIDQAIALIDAGLRKPVERFDVQAPDLPSTPITVTVLQAEAPSSVRLILEGCQLDFAEDVDWAERGTTFVHGELQLTDGDVSRLASRLELDQDAATKLEMSIFELATSARDRALEGTPGQSAALVSDLLTTCPVCGDLVPWNKVCLSCDRRNTERLQLEEERKRLFADRDSILKDRGATIERLPSLRKRLVETAAAIEKRREIGSRQ